MYMLFYVFVGPPPGPQDSRRALGPREGAPLGPLRPLQGPGKELPQGSRHGSLQSSREGPLQGPGERPLQCPRGGPALRALLLGRINTGNESKYQNK